MTSSPRIDAMAAPTTTSLKAMHRHQTHRDRWPDWDAFDAARYPAPLRRAAAVQWAGRARAEHSSIHQFTALSRALCEARVPLELLGALARLITDEVRHADICARTALVYYPEGIEDNDALFEWDVPKAPWPDAARILTPEQDPGEVLLWATDAIIVACCFGETLSVPMLKAIATVATDEVAASVAEQILRDEHLHARFGWETVSVLLGRLDDDALQTLQDRLPAHMRGFERSTCIDITLEDVLADPSITIEPTPDGEHNLGVLTHKQYATIFYATIENEIFSGLADLGFDPMLAWGRRFL